MVEIVTPDKFGKVVSDISKTDRWVLLCGTGKQGEGKSNLASQILKAVARYNKTPFTFDGSVTWSRRELKTWVDGDATGNGRKPERSPILADELISMFFKRNWFDAEQIDGIELLNKCRDRHLVIAGNVPNWFSLDSALYPIIVFRIHVHERGRAFVWQPDDNPFIADPWHITENAKIWAKDKHPYNTKGFVCEIHFKDFTPEDKEAYYKVRNEKRRNTEGQREKVERYRNVKEQRDKIIRLLFKYNTKLKNKDVADIIDITPEAVRQIREGLM